MRRGLAIHGSSWLLRVAIVLVSVLAVEVNPYAKPLAHIVMGIAILLFGLLPLDAWLRSKKRRTIPVFELHMLFYALTFGVAAFIDLPRPLAVRFGVNEQSYGLGLRAALLGLLFLYIGYFGAKTASGTFLARMAPRFPVGMDRHAIVALYPLLFLASLTADYLQLGAVAQIVPAIRLFTLVWALCVALLGDVSARHVRLVLYIFLPAEVMAFSGLLNGYLIGLLTYGELITVCFVLCRHRMPVVLIVASILAFFVLQPIKNQFRHVVWFGTDSMTALERVDLMAESAAENTEQVAARGGVSESLQETYARLNHLGDTSGFIQSTQAADAYLSGATLVPILTKWIPRFLWPEKPIENIANELGRRYGFLDQHDYITSLNLPWLAEMFINFGWWGIVIINCIVGAFIRMFKNGIVDRVSTPVQFAFAYAIGSGFFFPESNMSIAFGQMIIAWISISVFLVALRLSRRIVAARGRTERV